MKILIKDVSLLNMIDEDIKNNMNVIIDGNRIVYVGKELKEDINVEKTIDGKDKLLMPGLVNAHTHVGMSLLRNYADDLPLMKWLEEKIWPEEAKLTSEDVYWGSLLSMIEMIENGATSFCDMYFFMDAVGQAAEKIGMRTVLTRGMTENPSDPMKSINETKDLHKHWHNKNNGLITVMVAPHSPYTCGTDFLKTCVDLAKELETGIHIHLSETKKEVEDSIKEFGMTPIKRMDSIGMFDVHTIAAHCVHVTEEDMLLMKEKNVYPVNNPGSNLKLASGFAPVQRMLDLEIPVSLGTDGASSNNNLNMFEEINLAALVNKAVNLDALSVGAFDALKMGTINGAKALNFKNLGSIEEGSIADVILIDLDKPHLYPRHNMTSALAYTVQGSDVETVIIDGNIVMENREFKNIDVDEVKYMVEKLGKDLINRK
ncbi:MAG TPA: amidohydrolase [Tissierellaceae bacterium]